MANNDINHVILICRTTRDFELRYTPAGTAIASCSVASGRSYTVNNEKKEETSFFDVSVWGKLAEIMTEHCKKGQQLCIEGRLKQNVWDDQDGKKKSKVEIVINSFQFIGGKKDGEKAEAKPADNKDHGPDSFEENPFSDDDVPF